MIHSVPYFQSLATNQGIACEFCIVQKLQSQRLLSPPPPASAGQRLGIVDDRFPLNVEPFFDTVIFRNFYLCL